MSATRAVQPHAGDMTASSGWRVGALRTIALAELRQIGQSSLVVQLESDDVVTLRQPKDGDDEVLVAGRDDESRRWLGPDCADPKPTACIVVNGEIVGWVDYDTDREWLEQDEVNVGYNVFALHRRRGYAARAVRLLLEHLGRTSAFRTATLLIDAENVASLGIANTLGFEEHGAMGKSRYFKLAIPREHQR